MKSFSEMKTKAEKIAFLYGQLYGIWRFAWWKDGRQQVGTTGTLFADVEHDIERRIEIVEKSHDDESI